MLSAIEARFLDNLERVRNVVKIYVREAGSIAGRPSVQEADVLRAAVVLLHATLEDLLRSLAAERIAKADPTVLAQVPLAGTADFRSTKFSLGELASHRGSSVEEVIVRSVISFLERSSYNHLGDVVKLLSDAGFPSGLIDPYKPSLAAMMKRRHLIAHRADRNEATGRGQHRAVSIGKSTVERWIAAVEGFGLAILAVA